MGGLGVVVLNKNVDRISFFWYNPAERLVVGMLVKYSYINQRGQRFGFFQCDFEDFRQFFFSRNDLKIVTLIKNRRVYQWSKRNKKWLDLT